MKISATQLETWLRCHRQWWLQYPHRLPTMPKDNTDFGTVIHGVTERFRKADDTGRDPATGQPVDLYPPGWDQAEGRRIPSGHAELIRRLVDAAIESGVLERRPGRQVEKWFERDVIPGIKVVGKIDCQVPGEIEDDKSTKDLKWAKNEKPNSSDYLGRSPQMLLYAHELIADSPALQSVGLRHNYYCKKVDKPVVRKVRVEVSREEVESNWLDVQRQAADMLELATTRQDVSKWEEIEAPQQKGACDAFGGCPFQSICGKVESPAQYRERLDRQLRHHVFVPEVTSWDEAWGIVGKQTSEDDSKVDLFNKLVKPSAAPAATASGPAINGGIAAPVAPDPVRATPMEAPKQTGDTPPWAVANCPACKGRGFNSMGDPCRICDSKQKQAGGVVSANYVIEKDGAGNVIWEARDGSGGGSAKLGEAPPTTKVEIRMQVERAPAAAAQAAEPAPAAVEPAAPPKVEPMQPVVSMLDRMKAAPKTAPVTPAVQNPIETIAEVNQSAIEAETPPATAGAKRGRPRIGWTLYIDCMPTGVATTVAESIFAEYCDEMAKQAQKESYYDMDPFKRREAFARYLNEAALDQRLGTSHVVVRNPSGSPDLRAFVDALVAVARPGRVIQGIR